METPKEMKQLRATLMKIVGYTQNTQPELMRECYDDATAIAKSMEEHGIGSCKAFLIMALMLVAAFDDVDKRNVWRPVVQ